MSRSVIVEAVRTPIARGKPIAGWYNGIHATKLLALCYKEIMNRTGLTQADIEQIYAGCVTQAGEQSNNIARNSWLSMGIDYTVGATSVDTQCGSAMAASHVIDGLVNSGQIKAGIAGGVEAMSRVGLGANAYNGPGFFQDTDWPWDSTPDQFSSAQRIAENRGITREDCDALAFESQRRAKQAWEEGRFDSETFAVEAPIMDVGEDGMTPVATGESRTVTTDQGIRDTTMEGLAGLKAVHDENFVHTAGNSSQISDGSAALLIMDEDEAKARGLKPRARIIQGVITGTDPYYLLDGPIDATNLMFKKTGMNMGDIDLFEVNEAFASVVLSWQRVFDADMDKVNVNGGAIAIGHPVGSTGARLIVTALNELERQDKNVALCTMCCGASIGAGTIIERI